MTTWNVAAEEGPRIFKWWQDWRGECCAIIASGPSTKQANVGQLRDRIHVIAIKENVNLAPWAEVVYGCDAMWWNHRRGLPEYKGVKLAHGLVQWGDIHKIHIPNASDDKILTDKPAYIGSGGNSGFQAINIAVQFGCTEIMLIGYDCHSRGGEHWYGRNLAPGMGNPQESNFQRWRRGFDAAAPVLKSRGIEVINCTPSSTVKAFPVQSIELTLKQWGL